MQRLQKLQQYLSAMLVVCLTTFSAMADVVKTDHLESELVSELTTAQPGSEFWLALRFKHEPHWHTYWKNPGDSGQETVIEWDLPEGVKASTIHWPIPESIRIAHLINYGYSDETLLLTKISVAEDYQANSLNLAAKANWLICKEVCIPGKGDYSLTINIAETSQASSWQPAIQQTAENLPQTTQNWTGSFVVEQGPIDSENTEQAEFVTFEFLSTTDKQTKNSPSFDHVYFFPETIEYFDHGKDPVISIEKNRLTIKQALTSFREDNPTSVPGLLVLYQDHDVVAAYQLTTHGQYLSTKPSSTATASPMPSPTPEPKQALSLWYILALALLGGIVLNLMPCVFPVLFLKVMTFVDHGPNLAKQKLHGFSFTAGVLLTFLIAGIIVAIITADGGLFGWGTQMQIPWFVALLAYLFVFLALAFAGMVEIGASLAGIGQKLTERQGYQGSFFTGVLAVVVASPCTAPGMGIAMGYAVTQPAAIAILVFLVLGLGMALPLLALSCMPKFIQALPKPGRWMETLKQFFAFPLLATAIWLLWVVGQQSSVSGLSLILLGSLLIALSLWLVKISSKRKTLAKITGLLLTTLAISFAFSSYLKPASKTAQNTTQNQVQAFTPARLEQLLQQQKAVFLNLTADWCITCKVNEGTSLNTDEVQQKMQQKGVVYLKGDWTNYDEDITKILNQYQRPGVPLYLLYLPGETTPKILPQILTPSSVIEYLDLIH